MTNWDTLTTYFLDRVQHPRYGSHAREMYKLMLVLRAESQLANAAITADYLYVTINPPGTDAYLLAHNEQPDFFAVSLCSDGHVVDEDHDMPLEFVPALIQYYMEQITTRAFSNNS